MQVMPIFESGMASFKALRQVALLLGMALMVNLFHAAIMPVQALAPSHADMVITMPHAHHACDEVPASTDGKSCQLSGHLCCLGMTAVTPISNAQHALQTPVLNLVVQTLRLQIHPELQFKPPDFS